MRKIYLARICIIPAGSAIGFGIAMLERHDPYGVLLVTLGTILATTCVIYLWPRT